MNQTYRLGKAIYLPERKQICFDSFNNIVLSRCENCLLQFLIENPYKLITPEAMYRHCFIYFLWRKQSIHQVMERLSSKLANLNYIESPINNCYQFNFNAIKVKSKPQKLQKTAG